MINIIHEEGSSHSATITMHGDIESKIVYIIANDDDVTWYEASSMGHLAEITGIMEWWQGKFTIEALAERCRLSEVDCDSGYGEALYIDGIEIACAPELYILTP